MERQYDYMRDKSSWGEPLADQPIEHWDEDDFANLDDIQFRTASTASSTTSWQQTQPSHIDRRDSILSRLSARSDRGSNQDDQDWDVVVDQPSVNDAVAIAKRTGIPIPTNVPQSALIGGTIRKMPGKKIKQAMSEDWTEDLDFDGPLRLRSTSNSLGTPPKTQANHDPDGFDDDFDFPADGVLKPRQVSTKLQATPSRPPPNDTDNFGGDFDLSSDGKKFGAPRLPIQIQAPTPRPRKREADDFEADLELPKDGILKRRQPSTPLGALYQPDDLDLEWAEGSLGTRNAGTRRDGRSNRSSSASAFSPSMSSAITESEDEGLDGLILPAGPLRFEEILKKRRENQSPDAANYSGERNAAKRAAAKDDFFSGIEVGDGDIFDAGKLTLNRNIKHKIQRQTSPARRPATTLTFTNNKPGPTISRLPRFQATKDRARPTLEPVSESGNAVSRYRRPESRAIGHTAQSSTSSIPTPSPPSAPSTPSRRGLRTQESHDQIRYDAPTTTSTQLLRAKRSMPVMRHLNSPSKLPPYPRPPSRNNEGVSSRLHIPSRPKTPTDRAESRLGEARRPPVPFLPAGASTTQSQHVSIKSTTIRHYRRNDSDGSNDGSLAGMRSHSRLAYRPETPGRGGTVRGSLTPAELAAAAKKTITKPTRRRNFGDGNELDIFDDLPTSASAESKFIKQPVGRGAPRSLRSRLGQSHIGNSTTSLSTRGGAETPMPITPLTPNKPELNVPRFARDTAASRIAREQRQVSTTYNPRENARGPLTPISDNWKAHIVARPNLHAPSSRKRGSKVQQKPHLIKAIGDGHLKEPKSVKGMQYNPLTFRWEGNENDLEPFEIPAFHPPSSPDGSPNSKPPALITNVGQPGGVQVVGEMVFDPRRMCWLKMAPASMARDRKGPDSGGVSSVQLEDEEDVFAGLEDLKEEDETGRSSYGGAGGGLAVRAGEGMRQVSSTTNGDGSGDELGPVLGEEFDVGPEFIRRQRAEEEKWRRKVEGWLRAQESMDVDVDIFSGWRWQIREIVNSTASR